MPINRVICGLLAGAMMLIFGACTITGISATTTTAVRRITTVTTLSTVPASDTSGVKHFLALVGDGLHSTFTATYQETSPKRRDQTIVLAQRDGQWRVSSSPQGTTFNLKSGLVFCAVNKVSKAWQCDKPRRGEMSGMGYFLDTTDGYIPNGLEYQLWNGLYEVAASFVHLYSRTVDGRLLTCLALTSGIASGDTWCILPTGQFAYFWSDSGSSQIGAQGVTLTHISYVVPTSAFVLPAVATSAPL